MRRLVADSASKVVCGSRMAAGTIVNAGLFRATVLEAGSIGPMAVRFDFTQYLDEETLFFRWADSQYQPVAMPPPGDFVELPGLAQSIGRLCAPAPTCRQEIAGLGVVAVRRSPKQAGPAEGWSVCEPLILLLVPMVYWSSLAVWVPGTGWEDNSRG